jgi:hypothetical protein
MGDFGPLAAAQIAVSASDCNLEYKYRYPNALIMANSRSNSDGGN